MVKRAGNLFEKAFSKANLYQAFQDARREKRAKRSCFNFERRLARNLATLHEELHGDRYAPRPYYSFVVHEPKRRTIYAPAFRDLVVQHAIYRIVYPLFNARFIGQSFACRKGMGTHMASDYAQRALQLCPADAYTLKLDIRKFFYTIDRDVLRAQIQRIIKDRRLLDLMMLFADYGEPKGIPIGNLLSQVYALVYLNPLDHFVKRQLKARLYCRYVDDFVLFGLSRRECVEMQQRIERFLADELGLTLSRATIAPVSRGVNFVGFRTWRSKRFVRKRSLYNFRRAIKTGKLDSITSILGHARRTHSIQWLIETVKERDYGLYLQLPKVYRR